jgi:hypothetical protein
VFDKAPNLNGKGLESTPFYLTLSAIILLLTALIISPAYSRWQDSIDLGKTAAETREILSAIETIHSLGDVGSVQQIELSLPRRYGIEFRYHKVAVIKGNETLKEYPVDSKLRYRGINPVSGPGGYHITVVYWMENDSTNEDKEFLLEVLG